MYSLSKTVVTGVKTESSAPQGTVVGAAAGGEETMVDGRIQDRMERSHRHHKHHHHDGKHHHHSRTRSHRHHHHSKSHEAAYEVNEAKRRDKTKDLTASVTTSTPIATKPSKTRESIKEAVGKDDDVALVVAHEYVEQDPRQTYHASIPSTGTDLPGAFREGDSNLSSSSDDIELGLQLPPPVEAHLVDETLEQKRYDHLYGDLERMRQELENKKPVLVHAQRMRTVKTRLSSLYSKVNKYHLLLFVVGCTAFAVMVTMLVDTVEPTPPHALSHVLPFLKSISPDNGTALEDVNSPQFRAATWLAGNSNIDSMANRTKIQRYALATLFYATGGDEWTNKHKWLTDANECEWYNSKWNEGWQTDPDLIRSYEFCDEETGALEMMFLTKNNLRGQLPMELSLLDSLGRLEMKQNHLSGTFPSVLFQLPLWWLELTLNANIVGSLPSEIGTFSDMQLLGVGRTGLSGPVPTEIGRLTKLETLGLEGNEHTGAIPTELGLATALKEILLEGNKLTGTIPKEVLTVRLEKLNVGNNLLMGRLPSEMSLLTDLEYLKLQMNSFVGTIPSTLGKAPLLKDLYLGDNGFSGTFPVEVSHLTNLEHLAVHNNSLTGTIPTELGLATSLSEIALYGNAFTGTVPTQVTSLPLLEELSLFHNSFIGTIAFSDGCPLLSLKADCDEIRCDCCKPELCCSNDMSMLECKEKT